MERKYVHICEVCGKTEILTPEQAFLEGWDYPPKIGMFGIVSPRTCGNCAITDTLWWKLEAGDVRALSDLSEHQREVLSRIRNEPWSILPDTDTDD